MKIKDVDNNIGVPIMITDYLGGTGSIITIISRKRSLVSFKYADSGLVGLIHRQHIVSFSRV